MPPSGYSHNQTNSIADFLVSCSTALRGEAIEKNLTPSQALSTECSNILHYLSTDTNDSITTEVLKLTLAFYKHILEHQPRNFDEYENIVQDKALQAKAAILAIHVPNV